MILYFSGTGNSKYVATLLSEQLGEQVMPMIGCDGKGIEDKRIIWVFPTYSWGVPPVVANVIKSISLSPDSRHFMVTTCGDDIGLCHKMWRKIIRGRGWKDVSTFSVTMPNSYVCMKGFDVDSEDLMRSKLAAAPDRVKEVAQRIESGEGGIDDVVKGSWAWIKTRIIYPYFVRFCMSPKGFEATETCVGCGKCVMRCPMGNIQMKDGRPVWGDNCAFCLACYHQCSGHCGVRYGKETDGKGHYYLPKVKVPT